MKLVFIGLFLLLIATASISLTLGNYPISYQTLFEILTHGSKTLPADIQLQANIVFDIRLPRILAAILIGASYAISGAAFQALFINPLVSPGILGVLSGSAFGAALGIVYFDHWVFIQLSSFFFGVLAVVIALLISRSYRSYSSPILLLILGGIISGALFSTLLSIIKFTADPYSKLPSIVYWLMGSLANVHNSTLLSFVVPMGLGIFGLIAMSKYLDVLSFGEEEAKSLGINTTRIRILIICFASLISALSVSLGGMIGWIGLIIPHIARLLVGPNNTRLLPMCALIGAIFLIVVDDFARLLFSVELPIGIITSLVGIPLFILALNKAKRGIQ